MVESVPVQSGFYLYLFTHEDTHGTNCYVIGREIIVFTNANLNELADEGCAAKKSAGAKVSHFRLFCTGGSMVGGQSVCSE